MDLLRDDAIDPSPLAGRRVAILGYGNQGRAQALNLADSGIEVVVGLRDRSASFARVETDGLAALSPGDATDGADVVMMLAPDECLGESYEGIEPRLRQGAALGFAHGLAVRFELLKHRADLDVFMVAPKGPGTALRSLYAEGRGMLGLWAVAQNPTGQAKGIALAYGRAIGCGRAGLLETTFAEECEADLFNEQAVVWGAVPAILVAGFETLVEAGIRPEIAYMECVGELSLLADLIEQRGIAGMREAISNTAELGALIGGPRIVDEAVRAKMRAIMGEVRAGKFAEQLRAEAGTDYPALKRAREADRAAPVEEARRALNPKSGSDPASGAG